MKVNKGENFYMGGVQYTNHSETPIFVTDMQETLEVPQGRQYLKAMGVVDLVCIETGDNVTAYGSRSYPSMEHVGNDKMRHVTITEFLIYKKGWIWADANNYKPMEGLG